MRRSVRSQYDQSSSDNLSFKKQSCSCPWFVFVIKTSTITHHEHGLNSSPVSLPLLSLAAHTRSLHGACIPRWRKCLPPDPCLLPPCLQPRRSLPASALFLAAPSP